MNNVFTPNGSQQFLPLAILLNLYSFLLILHIYKLYLHTGILLEIYFGYFFSHTGSILQFHGRYKHEWVIIRDVYMHGHELLWISNLSTKLLRKFCYLTGFLLGLYFG